jgi:hypothetical protein
VVWHAPEGAPPDALPAAELAGRLGSLMLCQTRPPSAAFQSEYLPFFDQYAQSLQLWSPGSDAFCYPAVDAPTSEHRRRLFLSSVGSCCTPSRLGGFLAPQGDSLVHATLPAARRRHLLICSKCMKALLGSMQSQFYLSH